jgi:hypothetical protein
MEVIELLKTLHKATMDLYNDTRSTFKVDNMEVTLSASEISILKDGVCKKYNSVDELYNIESNILLYITIVQVVLDKLKHLEKIPNNEEYSPAYFAECEVFCSYLDMMKYLSFGVN